MANGTTTLYVSDDGIQLMVTRGKRITKLAEVPLEPDGEDITPEQKEQELAAKIKDLFKRNHIGARKITLGISGLQCLTRPLTLPDLPRAMLDEAVTREARRVLPVPPEQLYISWQSLTSSTGVIQAFMVAIPRYIADMLLKALAQAGFKPCLMDIKPLALARLARVPSCVIIDVQPSEFDIIIMSEGMPQPVRTLPFPEEDLPLEKRMEIVKDELERTIQFFNSNNPEHVLKPGTPMLVSGELADEPSLYEALAATMGLEASPLTSPLKCLKHLDPSRHLVNVGLALKHLPKEAGPLLPNFNTLPTHLLPKQISLNRLIAMPMTATAVALIILLALTIQNASGDLDAVRGQLDSTNLVLAQRQAEKQELNGNITSLQATLSDIESKRQGFTAVLETLTGNGNLMNNDLNTTVDNVVNDLDLSAIGHTGTIIDVRGKASSEREVMQYVRELTSTGRFTEITIANITSHFNDSDNTTSMDFALNLQVKEATR